MVLENEARRTRSQKIFLPKSLNISYYQIKKAQNPVKDMGMVDYLTREAHSDQWHESELDQMFVVTTINFFHKAIDCVSSTLKINRLLNRNGNVLEHSRTKEAQNSSLHGPWCYGNQNGHKRPKLKRNDTNQLLRSFKQLNSKTLLQTNTFSNFQPRKRQARNSAKTIQNHLKTLKTMSEQPNR